jgi:hypothetical protein
MTSNGCHTREEQGDDNPEQQHNQQYAKHKQPAERVAEVHRPSKANAPGDKYRRVVRVVIKETCIPVPVIVAENDSGAIGGYARFSSQTRSWQEQDENDGNQYPADQQESRPGYVHNYNPFDVKREYISLWKTHISAHFQITMKFKLCQWLNQAGQILFFSKRSRKDVSDQEHCSGPVNVFTEFRI